MDTQITFDSLPSAVSQLNKKLENIERLLTLKNEFPSTDVFMSVTETSQFLNLSIATIYSKVSKRELPVLKRGKRLYFSKTELLEYLEKGRKKLKTEIEAEANAYLSNSKTGNNGKR